MSWGVQNVSAAELTCPRRHSGLLHSSKTLTCDFLFSPAVRVAVWPNATVQEGQQVNLTCLVWSTHQDSLSYTWYKGGQQLLGARSISLPSVTVLDATSYRCGVGLPGHAPHLSRPVTLDVLCEFGWVWAVVERVTETPRARGMGGSPSMQSKNNQQVVEHWTSAWGKWGQVLFRQRSIPACSR